MRRIAAPNLRMKSVKRARDQQSKIHDMALNAFMASQKRPTASMIILWEFLRPLLRAREALARVNLRIKNRV